MLAYRLAVKKRLSSVALVLLFVPTGLFVLLGVPAQAAVIHAVIHEYLPEPSSEITKGAPEGQPLPGSLSEPRSMTVDAGELFLADGRAAQYRLDKFNTSSGVFASQFPQDSSLSFLYQGVAVGHATGEPEVYVGGDAAGTTQGVVAVFNAAGGLQAVWTGANTPSEAFGCFECNGTGDVAVDNSASLGDWAAGDVYVADPLHAVVDVFKPEAGGKEPAKAEVRQLTGTCPSEGTICGPAEVIPFSKPTHVAVSAFNGDVLVADGSDEQCATSGIELPTCIVDVFEPVSEMPGVYEFLFTLTGTPSGAFGHISALAVDGSDGDFYVADSHSHAVDEFDSTGKYRGHLTGTQAGPFTPVQSVAVDPAPPHNVFVGNYNVETAVGSVNVFGPNLVVPGVITEEPSNVTPRSATLNGTVELDKEGPATCQFVWGTTKEFGQTAACSANVEVEAAKVHADLGQELQPDTTYFYRLQATNKNGTNSGEESDDKEFTTPGPGIHNESASNVKSTSATLSATINPHNAPTTYYFQYGPSTGYSKEAPVLTASEPHGAVVGSEEGDVIVTPQHVQGLLPGTVYHYRVVAVSELEGGLEEFNGPDQTFTTQTAGGGFTLPDERGWEMVSPPDKHGANILAPSEGYLAFQAASAGNAITYLATAPTENEPQGFSNVMQVLSTRGSEAWASRNIGISHKEDTGAATAAEYPFFSSDLSLGAVHALGTFDPSVSAEASENTPYLRTDYPSGNVNAPCEVSCYRPLVTGKPGYANVPEGTVFGGETEGKCSSRCGPEVLGAAPDFSHVVLESAVALTPTAVKNGLYEWAAGRLALVSLLPASEGGADSGSLGNPIVRARRVGAISDDGSRVIWTADGNKHLYMRVNAMQPQSPLDAEGVCTVPADACTVRLDAGLGGTPRFQTASKDASRVLFTESGDLYEYDIGHNEPLRLTEGAKLQGAVLGASEDGSWAYFVAEGVLAAGAELGAPNLYVHHDGTTKLVAVLSLNDAPDWGQQSEAEGEEAAIMSARVSPSGRWLAFMSQRSLTGYDNRDAISVKPDEEVYLYDASSPRLLCASCDPTGARPVGQVFGNEISEQDEAFLGANRAWNGTGLGFAGLIPGWIRELHQSRYLSDSGRLLFNSHSALVPQDVDGTWDVYEYEPPGVGDCSISSATFGERSGGCVGLISSGASAEASAFLDASESGSDVFFLTTAKLASQDFDTSVDVYDAHECTGASPCLPAPPPPQLPCSTGDSCKPAPSPQPEIFGSAPSEVSSGAGNLAPAPHVPPKPLTRAQKLTKALGACRKKYMRSKARRTRCERHARKQYGAKRSRKANARKGGGGR